MRLSAKAPIVIRGEEITHLDADGYKHLPRATSLPDGKVLATSGGKWAPSDLSGISVSSVFGRTGAVAAQTGDYTAAQVGAEPYAGVPAQTSFWRSTAAGVRAWVQLFAADITDLATTLAAYLTKESPTFTGTLTGPVVRAEGDWSSINGQSVVGRSGQAGYYSMRRGSDGSQTGGIGWMASATESTEFRHSAGGGGSYQTFLNNGVERLRIANDGSLLQSGAAFLDASRNGTFKSLASEENVFLPGSIIWKSGATNYFLAYGTSTDWTLRSLTDAGAVADKPISILRAAGGEIQIGYSGGLRPVRIGGTLKNDALAGTGNRPLVAGADGTIDDQDAATFRGTIGALAATDPVFTGALKQGATTRVTAGGDAWFASMQATNLIGAGDRPIAADLTGTIQPKTPDQFRNMISALSAALKGAANGVAELGADGRVPSGQLPSYVDDVLEYATFSAFPATGETGKIYISQDDNKTWRWSGSAYVEISASLALGETSATAYRGDRGKIAYDHSQATGNPHGATAADVGAAKAPSRVDVSASTTIGSIDATSIKVVATDVILTLSGGVDGQGWDIINPTAATGIAIPSGATLWKSIGSDVGPTTIALGGGRPVRITRIDANTWTMLGSQ